MLKRIKEIIRWYFWRLDARWFAVSATIAIVAFVFLAVAVSDWIRR